MASCPACNYDSLTAGDCPVCGYETAQGGSWIRLGTIDDSVSADFAREVLRSYEVPAVVISKSGFFGQFGLFFHGFHSGELQQFELRVPETHADEASALVQMAIGQHWHGEDRSSV